ncbi:MAG: 5-oxoprolinase subunit PxpA [Acidimicrobiia bacterium]|nr:5-oxoprolinase subunit PxpA [Acidimicrobiia bacterium]
MDLNADLGESYGTWRMGDDEAMLQIVTSANVACGYHAGDPSTLRTVCRAAAERQVAVGAHVAYPDLAGFGRRARDVAPEELRDQVLYHRGALDGIARVEGPGITYVKPHGALYHAVADDPAKARAVVAAALEYDPSLAMLGPPASQLLAAAADAGLAGISEAFVDRAYESSGRLVPRGRDGSVLTDVDEIALRAVRMAVDREVRAVDGSIVEVRAQSLCVHGDTPGAVDIARAVRAALDIAGLDVRRFTD